MGMDVDNQDIRTIYARHDERLRNIYSTLNRIEKHLERLNGKVSNHDTDIARFQTWGAVALVTFPIMINIIMRFV